MACHSQSSRFSLVVIHNVCIPMSGIDQAPFASLLSRRNPSICRRSTRRYVPIIDSDSGLQTAIFTIVFHLMSQVRCHLIAVAFWAATLLGIVLAVWWIDSQWHLACIKIDNIQYNDSFDTVGFSITGGVHKGVAMVGYDEWNAEWPSSAPKPLDRKALQAATGFRFSSIYAREDGYYYPNGFFGLCYPYQDRFGTDQRIISVPIMPFALLLLLPATLRFRRWRKARALARIGLCRYCSYDLRASIERCPECGKPILPVIPADAPLWLRVTRHSLARLYGCMAIATASLYLAFCAAYKVVYFHILHGLGTYDYQIDYLNTLEQWCRAIFWFAIGATALLFFINAVLFRFRRVPMVFTH